MRSVLKNDGRLTGANYLTLMVESFKTSTDSRNQETRGKVRNLEDDHLQNGSILVAIPI